MDGQEQSADDRSLSGSSSRSRSSTVYARRRVDKAEIAVVSHRESNARAIAEAMQKLSEKLHRLQRERDAAMKASSTKTPTSGEKTIQQTANVAKSSIDAARRDCDSIEHNLRHILRTCKDVISHSSKPPSDVIVKQHGMRKSTGGDLMEAPVPLTPSSNSDNTKFGSHRVLADMQMLIRILKMGRPQLDAETGNSRFNVTDRILNIVLHYLREAIAVLRGIVAHLTVEWVQMSRTIKSTEDPAKNSFLKDLIRTVKVRRTNLTLSVHRLEKLTRKVVRLIHVNSDKFKSASREETASPAKTLFLITSRRGGRNKTESDHSGKDQNLEALKCNSGLELLKCIKKLHDILSHV